MARPAATRFSLSLALGVLAAAGCGGTRAGENRPAPKALPEKVLVLPFEDLSGSGNPGLAAEVTGLFVARLRLTRFGTMGHEEAAELAPWVAEIVPSRLDAETVARVASATGCEAIVAGAVTVYARGGALGGDRVGLRARAVDTRTGRPIGGASFSSEALKSSTLQRGIDQLTQFGVEELVERLTRDPR